MSHCGSSLFTGQLSMIDRRTPVQSTSYSLMKSSFFLHHYIISYLPQDDASSYPEFYFLLLHLHCSLYHSPDGGLDLFQYLLVSHPVLTDKSPRRNQCHHCKYLPCCTFHIQITHLCFLRFFLFVVDGPFLPN